MFGGFPFGGAGFDMPGMRPPKKGDSSRYYDLLGVSKDCSETELKKAYRKAGLQHHPDKGGDADKFKEINEAYDVLKDPEKRRIYDEYGEEALKEGMGGGGGGGGGMDIFDLFGGGGRGGRSQRERKSDDVRHNLQVSLEELYNGVTKKLSLSRKLPCSKCNGSGSKSGKRDTCETCHGSGVQVMIRPIGPGMVQQIQQPCRECSGNGFSVKPSDRCAGCHGSCLVSEKKTFEVQVEQGMKHGQRIVLRGEAGCTEPGLTPGDVVLVVQQKQHEVFKRIQQANPADLLLEKTISLKEALCGCSFTVQHLDGRTLHIKTNEGQVIKPNSFMVVQSEGMPVHGRPFVKGNLYVRFEVEFPESILPEQSSALSMVLPGPDTAAAANGAAAMDEDAEECRMNHVADFEEEMKHRHRLSRQQGGSNAYDSDEDDDMPRGQRMQCAQQ